MDGVGRLEIEVEPPLGPGNLEFLARLQNRTGDLVRLRDVVCDRAIVFADDFNNLFLTERPQMIDVSDARIAQFVAFALGNSTEQH